MTVEIARLWLDLVREEAKWGSVHPRPATAKLLQERLAAGTSLTICAVLEGELVGFVSGHRVPSGGSIQRRTAFKSVFYIDAIYVRSASRRNGLGRALATEIARSRDAAEVDGFALHYSQRSPLSAPFWTGMGFRALWQTWRLALTQGALGP